MIVSVSRWSCTICQMMRFAATPAVRFPMQKMQRALHIGWVCGITSWILRQILPRKLLTVLYLPMNGAKRRILVLTATDIWSLNSCTSELPCWAAMRLQPDTMHGLHTMKNGADGCWKSRRTRRKTKVMCCIPWHRSSWHIRFFRWGTIPIRRKCGSWQQNPVCWMQKSRTVRIFALFRMAIMQRLLNSTRESSIRMGIL